MGSWTTCCARARARCPATGGWSCSGWAATGPRSRGGASTGGIIGNRGGLGAGRCFPQTMHGYLVSEAERGFGRQMPREVAGDACGYQDKLHREVCPEQVELVDFTGAVH